MSQKPSFAERNWEEVSASVERNAKEIIHLEAQLRALKSCQAAQKDALKILRKMLN